ncbi:hypothetical protein EDD37DRAFT_465490 [Exophiala viscosa]|uniref:Uncharacterized protein n=1 Tax=Exophiala viscosa TaxID=2486360 RepID=A0AAN6IDP6_9EURO|nr:hypothetical protein EDD36DRAFT_267424 [Exophiala viscosa]KAI1623327.1 hypothetical protein EDD37DRAFT_465490 [Exophiala viscosa]
MAIEVPKESPTHVEEGVGSNKTFGQKFKRHCPRFWWIHLLILILIVLVVTLPVVFVAYPHIAQSEINKSRLVVTSQSLLNPAPDAFDLQLNSVFLSNSSLHAQLDAFKADLCLEGSDVPFAQLSIPALKAANGTEENVSQRVQIQNKQQFYDYAKTSLLSDEYVVYIKGKGGLKYGKLQKTTVNYNEKIVLKGMNGLKGFNVTDFELLTTAQPDGSNANGTVFMPNPSMTTYEMGNLTMDMYTDGVLIGNSTLHNVVLKPGNNTLPFRALTNQTAVVTLLFNKYKCGVFPVDIVTKRTSYNGQDLPYYDQALQSNNLTINLNVIEVLEKAGLAGYLGINTTNTLPC